MDFFVFIGTVATIFFCAVLLRLAFKVNRRRQLREAILQCFAKYAPVEGDRHTLDSISIDSDWVALILCGYSVETRIKKLPPDEEARVSLVSESVTRVAMQMVASGLLRYYAVSFANQGKNQKINSHPPTLFLLAPKGRAEVVKRLGKARQ